LFNRAYEFAAKSILMFGRKIEGRTRLFMTWKNALSLHLLSGKTLETAIWAIPAFRGYKRVEASPGHFFFFLFSRIFVALEPESGLFRNIFIMFLRCSSQKWHLEPLTPPFKPRKSSLIFDISLKPFFTRFFLYIILYLYVLLYI